ncbi:hypothetical protein ACFSBZ_13000 [Amnibacterium flavum]|uniref:Uncharacterized protein n=1 Tax=Amnibacterium flavum TaxID=2173173 RepID=A0A2V1HVD1_9MICO|nr:hypothetical protein [Amnibacterium flavum]PVZ95692.1 hypothetical protein DDQ50_04210 [Amnibacterium flavum]
MNPTSLNYVSHAVSAATSVADSIEGEIERARTLRLSGRPHHAVVAALSARMRCSDSTLVPGVRRVLLEAECSLEAGLAQLEIGNIDEAKTELERAGADGGVHLSPASRREYRDALVQAREQAWYSA